MKIKKLVVYFVVILLVLSFIPINVFAAEVGDYLTAPESGWKRYDDTDSNIEYVGDWGDTGLNTAFYNDGMHAAYTSSTNQKIRFNFTGDKLLLLAGFSNDNSDKIEIKIDNEIIDYYSQYGSSAVQRPVYINTGLEYKEHFVEITKINSGIKTHDFNLDAIDIDENGELKPYNYIGNLLDTPTALTATGGDTEISLTWDAITDAESYNVKRSTISGGDYEVIASDISTTSYTDTSVENDTTYYYVVSAVNSEGESDNSSEVSATPKVSETLTLDIEASSYEITGGTEFETYVVIKSASSIYAEDINITYDTSLFELVSAEAVDSNASKIYYEETETLGEARYVVASMGSDNALDGEVQILKLTFKANNVDGSGNIAIASGLVADGDGNELIALTLGKTFTVTSAVYGDVNNDGSFTLGDLAIAGRLFSTTSDAWETYEPDVDLNGTVEDVDLTTIVQAILASE